MNEIFIYKKIKYRKVLRNANILFENKCIWYLNKSVFAKKGNTYTVSIDKNCIRICYWDEYSENGIKAKNLIKKFLSDNFSGETLVISKSGTCDLLNDLGDIKIFQFDVGDKL